MIYLNLVMIGKLLFGIFVTVVIVLFLILKFMPLWLRIGLALAIPFFIVGLILLISWIFAIVLFALLVLVVLALIFGFKSKIYRFGRKKR